MWTPAASWLFDACRCYGSSSRTLTFAVYAGALAGRSTISTSMSSAVSTASNRSVEKPVGRRFIRRETSGCEIPSRAAAAVCVRPSALMRLAIWNVSCAFTSSAAASGIPRSSNTLPRPSIMVSSVLMPVLLARSPLFVVLLGELQPFADQLQLFLRRSDAALRLLLEDVQHIDHFTEADRVDAAERIAIVPGDDLEHGGIARSPSAPLGRHASLPLGGKQRITDGPAHLGRHGRQVVLSAGDPAQRSHAAMPQL